MIICKDINFSYKKKNNVINDLSFDIKRGQAYGILGHNGAGKSTIFKLVLGILKPTNGTITLKSEEIECSMSYMPENGGIYEKLTAIQNLKFRARISKLSEYEIENKIEELLKKLKLINRANEPVSGWSNGMKKRLSLACALISEPSILFLDEPTNGIDPESLMIVIDVLKKLNKDGTTLLIISHNLDFVKKVTDKILIMQSGRLIYEGATSKCDLEELYINKTREEDII